NPDYACGLAVNHAGNAWHAGSLPGTMSLMVHTHSKMTWAAVLNTRSTKEGAESRLDNMLWKIARNSPEWRV
ncbi:MAG TPA: penicillin-binding protein, partial [Verrucomicrobiota bacterium]|nr:penicillin-binding protein [Verrucomicrobiota bacterium]